MKIDEVRGLTPDQMAETLINLKKEQFNLRFQKATGQIEKTHRVDQVRKDIDPGQQLGGALDTLRAQILRDTHARLLGKNAAEVKRAAAHFLREHFE